MQEQTFPECRRSNNEGLFPDVTWLTLVNRSPTRWCLHDAVGSDLPLNVAMLSNATLAK